MLNYKIEIVITLLLIILLQFTLFPLLVTIYTDYLPTNASYTIEESIGKVISNGNTYKYIHKDDYLYILELFNGKYYKEHYMYKGAKSSYIPTGFTYGTGDKIERRAFSDSYGSEKVYVILKKHRDNYIVEIFISNLDMILNDENGNDVKLLETRNSGYFFDVLDSNEEEYSIYLSQNDKEYLIIDYKIITSLFTN